MKNIKQTKQLSRGFTIIELMIATMIFSVILLLSSFVVLQVGRMYAKGSNSAATQRAAQSIIDDVAQAVQFSSGSVTSPSPASGRFFFTAGSKCYTYILSSQLTDNTPATNQSNNVFTRNEEGNNCITIIDWTSADFTELLSQNMRIAAFYLCAPGEAVSSTCKTPTPANSGLYGVGVRVVYGDDDLLCSPSQAGDCDSSGASPFLTASDLACKNGVGSEYCAISELNTTVLRRL